MQSHMAFKFAKMVTVLGVVIVAAVSNVYAEDIPAGSKITEVTVYPGSARITRQANVNLSAGEHSIVFENIIPNLDENTITVNGKGVADVKIFGAYIKREYSKVSPDERAQELKNLIQDLEDDIKVVQGELSILRKESEYLDSIKLFAGQQVPKDLVTSMPSVENLEGVRSFLSQRYLDVAKKEEESRIEIREIKKEIEVAKKELNELSSTTRQQQRLLIVDLECAKAGKFDLNVSYLVHGAYWRSLYDARANYDKEEVELTSFGMIKQTTGEDWEDVQLTLSTAQPTVSGRLPYVEPWVLQPFQAIREQKALRGGLMKATAPAADSVQYEAYYLADKEEGMIQESVATNAYSQAEQKGVSIVYKIVRPVTIKSDGSENKYPISTQVLKAEFEYTTYPRLKQFAYLGSRVVNSKDLQLLAGQVNLFLDGDYVGKSSIDNIGPGQEFDLYLGVDENVKVKREQIARNVDDVLIGGIKSPNRTTTFEYKTTIENYKNKDIKVILFEAVPVSQNDRIKVKVLDVSEKPNEKDWKDRKGVWRWEFSLKPKGKKEIKHSFSVEHPRDMNIPGI